MSNFDEYLLENAIDLSHDLENGMPYYPGDPVPSFERYKTIEKDGVRITKIAIGSHTGTHMDAPAHYIRNGISIDKIQVKAMACKGILIDVSSIKVGDPIKLQDIKKYEDKIKNGTAVLFYTGWSKQWPNADFNKYTYLSEDVANLLASRKVGCVGIDTPSVEKFGSREPVVHKTILSAGIYIIELLNSSLRKISGKDFVLLALPLRLKDADGSPCRAVALPLERKVIE